MSKPDLANLNHPDAPLARSRIASELTRAAREVRSRFGPAGLGGVIGRAMAVQRRHLGLSARRQVSVPLTSLGELIAALAPHLLVEDLVVEFKSVDALADVRFAQRASALRHGNLSRGLLIRFRISCLRDVIHRRIHGRSTRFRFSAPSARTTRSAAPRPA